MASPPEPAAVPRLLAERRDITCCPICGAELDVDGGITCRGCGHQFGYDEGIPRFYWPHDSVGSSEDVTEVVKAFYEENPFPNYSECETRETLAAKARQAVLADVLDKKIGDQATVLEAGCGTGQLSNFLSMREGRNVFATDLCLNSLRLGHGFAAANDLGNIAFVQMNLFRPVFKPKSFDLVISNGVLHHTADPFGGFRSIAKLVKDDGLILIGLYNRYGRVMTNVRRGIFNRTGTRFESLDPLLRKGGYSEMKKRTWFMDQYKHPHESQHTMDEVLGWFDSCGIEFVNSLPQPQLNKNLVRAEDLLEPRPPGARTTRLLVQTQMAVADREGGFFVMIGRRRATA